MRVRALALPVFAAFSCSGHPGLHPSNPDRPHVVELPRPNSGTFTLEEAERRRSEIFEMSPSGMLHEWNNPFQGFSIHINDRDELTIYDSSFRSFSGMHIGTPYSDGPHVLSRANELRDVVDLHAHLLYGNPLGVLITSAKGGASTELPEVVDQLFMPSIQIYYLSDSVLAAGSREHRGPRAALSSR